MIPPKPGGRPQQQRHLGSRAIARRLKIAGAVAGALVLVAFIYSMATSDDSDVVPAPTVEMRFETSAQLAKATAVQGICYGWWLEDGRTGAALSRGSNLGAGAPVDMLADACAKWVEVRATVTYTDANSESEDFASVALVASNGFSPPMVADLRALGFTESAFIDDPAWAICEAALALPLLMAESGRAAPAPLATPAASAAPASASEGASSDFWRDRGWQVLAAGLLLLAGALMAAIGWFERKHEKTADRRAAAS